MEKDACVKQEVEEVEAGEDIQLFAGFDTPTKNFFHMPNNWTDITSQIDNLSELKVVEYVVRHTWGYQEYGIFKTISVDEFMHGRRRKDRSRMDMGTGLSEPSVKDGIRRALAHGYITCITDEKDKGRTKKSYAIKMRPASAEENGVRILPPQDSYPVRKLPRKKVTPRGQESYPRSEKDTLEKNPSSSSSDGENFEQRKEDEEEKAAFILANSYRLSPYTPEEWGSDRPFVKKFLQMSRMNNPQEGQYTLEDADLMYKSAYHYDERTGHGPWLHYPELTFEKLVNGMALTTYKAIRKIVNDHQQKKPPSNGAPSPLTRQHKGTVIAPKGYGSKGPTILVK